MKIIKIKGYEVLDSRGNPTVAAEVILENSKKGFAIVPSGASTGIHEAHELRDNETRYNGKGVEKAVNHINEEIANKLCGMDCYNQRLIDRTLIELDATPNKKRLGANALLAVSLAVAKAAASSLDIPLYRYIGGINGVLLPRPMMNILNGGAHAGNNIDIQEFMITPSGAKTFTEGLEWCTTVYHTLGKILKKEGYSTAVGDEGGFAPNLNSDEEAIEFIVKAIKESGFNDEQIKITLDVASSEWFKDGKYLKPKRNVTLSGAQLIDYYEELIEKYPIISIEDGVAEDDWEGWAELTNRLGHKIQLVGDDLFVTNTERLKSGVEKNVANAILVKPNQIGTLSETLDVIALAQKNGYNTIISHRSGETEDTTIADLSVAVNAGQIKTGAPCRSDRVSKYNRLIIIEKSL